VAIAKKMLSKKLRLYMLNNAAGVSEAKKR
jgi:hypothetical protein